MLLAAFTGRADPARGTAPDDAAEPMPKVLAVQMVGEARRTFGRTPTRLLWRQLGLPVVAGIYGPPDQGELSFTPTAPAA